MSTTDSAETACNFIERVWNTPGGGDLASSFLTEDYVDHAYAGNADGLRAAIAELRSAFPDAHFKIEDVVADGPKAAIRMRLRATHSGVFRTIAATERQIDVKVFRWFRIAKGRIAEHWAVFDTAALMRQVQG